jgi:hypothetical protein
MATQKVVLFSGKGHDVLLEYDPATASMEEVNATVDKLEKDLGGRAFSLATGESVEKVTRETEEVVILRPLAGG